MKRLKGRFFHMQDTGWIKLHRKLRTNIILQKDHSAYYVFTNLLMMVQSDSGQMSTGRFLLAESLGLKPSMLYKCLKKLEKCKMVTLESNNRFTVITICNWDKYQGTGNSASNNKVTTKQQPSNNKVTLYKNKELRIKKKELIQSTNVLTAKAYGNPDINELFEYWENTIGYKITAKTKENRNACSNLFKKHGAEKLKKLIDGVKVSQNDRYAPRISDFCSLQAKLNDLMLWGKQRQQPDKPKLRTVRV